MSNIFFLIHQIGSSEKNDSYSIDLNFSLYVLFSQFRPRDVLQGIYHFSFHMHRTTLQRNSSLGYHLTRSEMEKQNTQAIKVYCNMFAFVCHDYWHNNNNNNNNNGNFICVFEYTIVNLATYRQFTNAA